jgi:hypothetical protein
VRVCVCVCLCSRARRTQTSASVSVISSKELKDPDQLYTTLKNLLAQIKVGGQGLLVGN